MPDYTGDTKMINRDRMSEAEWMQRLINLRNRLERDADNMYCMTSMMETGGWSPLARGEEQKQLLEIANLMFRAEIVLSEFLENRHAEA
jgi:hypothetical protein